MWKMPSLAVSHLEGAGNDGPCLAGLMSRSDDFQRGLRANMVPSEGSMSVAVVTVTILRVFRDRGEPEIPNE